MSWYALDIPTSNYSLNLHSSWSHGTKLKLWTVTRLSELLRHPSGIDHLHNNIDVFVFSCFLHWSSFLHSNVGDILGCIMWASRNAPKLTKGSTWMTNNQIQVTSQNGKRPNKSKINQKHKFEKKKNKQQKNIQTYSNSFFFQNHSKKHQQKITKTSKVSGHHGAPVAVQGGTASAELSPLCWLRWWCVPGSQSHPPCGPSAYLTGHRDCDDILRSKQTLYIIYMSIYFSIS